MRRRGTGLLGAVLCGCLAWGVSAAGQYVRFEDGRAMEVSRIDRRGEMVELTLPGGGAIAVPAWRIAGWGESASPTATTPDDQQPADAWRAAAGSFAPHIERAAREHSVDPALLTAVARTESAFDPTAVSPKGASGLMQLMPTTAQRFGVTDVFDVSENVDGGARYLSWLLERFGGNTELALAGYNAGEAAVERFQGIPPYPETENYVKKVLREAARLTADGVETVRTASRIAAPAAR